MTMTNDAFAQANDQAGEIVAWLREQADHGISTVTADTIRCEFSDGTRHGDDITRVAIGRIRLAAMMIVGPF